MPARDFHLGLDIGPDPFDWTRRLIHAVRRMQPDLEDILHNAAVEILFRGKVIMQVRLGQPRHIRDQLHRRPAKACFREYFFRRLKNERFILLADFIAAQRAGGLGHGCKFLLTAWSGYGALEPDHTVRKRFVARGIKTPDRDNREKTMAAHGENLRINSARLWDSLQAMAQIGPGIAGGNNRQTLTDADAEGRRLFANWTKEEGPRLAPAMLASGVFAGIHTQDYAYARRDLDGKQFGEELARIGWVGDEVVGARKMHAMFELHRTRPDS